MQQIEDRENVLAITTCNRKNITLYGSNLEGHCEDVIHFK